MLILREEDIVSILNELSQNEFYRLRDSLWQAFTAFSKKDSSLIHQPIRERIVTNIGHTSLFMPASDTSTTTGLKVVTLPGGGGPPKGAINIFSPEGELDGILNAEEITAFRTALASMIPISQFNMPNESRVVIFGSGKQAQWHVRLLLLSASTKISRISIVSRSGDSLRIFNDELVAKISQEYPDTVFDYLSWDMDGFDSSLRIRVAGSDVICCCTPSTKPLFPDNYLRCPENKYIKKRCITLIGSYKANMREIDSDTLLSSSRILVDSKEACLKEAGELIDAGVKEEQLIEIGEMRQRNIEERVEEPEKNGQINTVFKCVGMGIMDLAIGRELLNVALGKGLGVHIAKF